MQNVTMAVLEKREGVEKRGRWGGGERNGYASKMESLKVDTNFCL